ncbi:hypothetical protein ACOMHN_024835 [Nucella lapillus]
MATAAAAAAGLGDIFAESVWDDDDPLYKPKKSTPKSKKSSPSRSGQASAVCASKHHHGHSHATSSPARMASRPQVKQDESRWLCCFSCRSQQAAPAR